MGKVRSKGLNLVFCFIVGMIVGGLIGIVAITTLVSYRMDGLYEKIASLENVINEKDAKLEKLEQSINTMYFVLEDIKVVTEIIGEDVEDNIDKIEIEKAIKEKYTNLLGKEVKTIDPDLVIEVIDKRIFKLEGKEYKLSVNKLVLTEIMKIWVDAKLVDGNIIEE